MRYSDEDVAVWVKRYQAGEPIRAIALDFPVSEKTVSTNLRAQGIRVTSNRGFDVCSVCKAAPVHDGGKCRTCLAAYLRNRNYLRKYGITTEQYEELLAAQDYCCALCGSDDPKTSYGFAVDHCHATGRLRGLLCFSCNKALGMLGDTEESLERALRYLRGS